MKTILNLLLIACFPILISCGSGSTDPENSEVPPPNQPTTKGWVKRANCGMSMYSARGHQIGDEIYYISEDNLWAYNYKTDKWAQKASLPEKGFRGAFMLNNKIYAFMVLGPNHKFLEYDPKTNLWSKSALPATREDGEIVYNGGFFVLNGIVYGQRQKYNEQKNSWEATDMDVRYACYFEGKAYSIGSERNGDSYLYEFNPTMKEDWIPKLQLNSILDDRSSSLYFVQNEKIHLFTRSSRYPYTNYNHIIDPRSNSFIESTADDNTIDDYSKVLAVTTTDGRVFIGPYNASYYEFVP